MLQQVLGAAGVVSECGGGGVDAEVVVERGEDVLVVEGAVLDRLAQVVGRADGLAVAEAAASEEATADGGPVVAAAVLVDPGGAAELAPDDDGDIAVQPSGVQVVD